MPFPLTQPNRRRFLQHSSAIAAAGMVHASIARPALAFTSPNQRPRIGVVGTGSRWHQRATGLDSSYGSGQEFVKFGDIVAVCDVDAERVARARDLVSEWGGSAPDTSGDYRKLIDRADIDVLHIVTPDHWHAKIAIEALKAGKDVYCEKPMTLTIEEGRMISKVCRETGRVMQVGTQQRSGRPFLIALALVQAGRIGKLVRAECRIGGAPTSPELPAVEPPKHLDWNRWLGPAPETPFRYLAGPNGETKSWSRAHYEFRWWYEYSGGKLTDWGAHHVDIATWALGKTDTGPVLVTPEMAKHPVEFVDGVPQQADRYNTATEFLIHADFADGVRLTIRHDEDNGILLEGTEGRLFVNRGRVTGAPVEALESNPLPDDALANVYKGRMPTDHFRNFFEAVAERFEPVSDVHSHHRALSTCHLAGIAARLNRPVRWDPVAERVEDDAVAQSLVGREYRSGFELES